VCLRILKLRTGQTTTRALGSWLSYDDLIQLVTRAVDTPFGRGFSVSTRVPDNDAPHVDNPKRFSVTAPEKTRGKQFAAETLPKHTTGLSERPRRCNHGGPLWRRLICAKAGSWRSVEHRQRQKNHLRPLKRGELLALLPRAPRVQRR